MASHPARNRRGVVAARHWLGTLTPAALRGDVVAGITLPA
jgi:hypothetical protein